jgi:hypothetical protein
VPPVIRMRARIGATRHSNPGGESKLVPPVIRMSQIAVPRQSRLVPPFSRAREHLNRCHPSVKFGRESVPPVS